MKVCSVCGCHNADDARVCNICGVFFPDPPVLPPLPEDSVPPPVEDFSASQIPRETEADRKSDRMALAGFILSLMGFVTCMTSPLQFAAFLLSVCAGRAKKFRTLRLIGIVLSAVALGISLFLWTVTFVNADTVLGYITNVMNEFYY